ncbi:MAG: hypothetical protein IAE82_21855 [Opitutaceae bacterium]|nr:hypothetical protein [Opitutaceae bacterium]
MAIGVAGSTVARAQTPAPDGATVEVRAVKFGTVRAPGGGDTWTEAVVELGILPAAGGGAYARWADNVRVNLSLGIRTRGGDYAFFRASAEAVALEAGRASIRFYLPPEIARREQLSSAEPYAWSVEVTVKGQPVPSAPGQVSTVLATPEALRSFKDRVARSSTLNDGVLVPQADSPFAAAYAGDTPALVRR